ncbi:MAG TPA: polyprenyl synthetase family protein, partial [Acidimicrobiia bacterium]|nr:polyprenyl synthetase family protein [Acidimicrobiia bacterium]
MLDRAREYTEPALRDAVRRLQPQLQAPVRYHLGWADEEGNPTSGGGGKGIRPALAILSAEATGALASVGVPGAVAV